MYFVGFSGCGSFVLFPKTRQFDSFFIGIWNHGVFPGAGGEGKVVNLENENTTLIEALALAGGITNTGKANKIKVIRGDLRNPKVMLVDLSTIEGMKQSNML